MNSEYYGPSLDAQQSVNLLLSLPATGREQDWEIELADPARVEEILSVYASAEISTDVRKALALLLLASIEQKSTSGDIESTLLERIKTALHTDSGVRNAMAFYWIGQRRTANTALMRRVLSQ